MPSSLVSMNSQVTWKSTAVSFPNAGGHDERPGRGPYALAHGKPNDKSLEWTGIRECYPIASASR